MNPTVFADLFRSQPRSETANSDLGDVMMQQYGLAGLAAGVSAMSWLQGGAGAVNSSRDPATRQSSRRYLRVQRGRRRNAEARKRRLTSR